MSANNKVIIYDEVTNVANGVQTYTIVEEVDADTGHKIQGIGRYEDRDAALKAASKYCKENEVEYGLEVIDELI